MLLKPVLRLLSLPSRRSLSLSKNPPRRYLLLIKSLFIKRPWSDSVDSPLCLSLQSEKSFFFFFLSGSVPLIFCVFQMTSLFVLVKHVDMRHPHWRQTSIPDLPALAAWASYLSSSSSCLLLAGKSSSQRCGWCACMSSFLSRLMTLVTFFALFTKFTLPILSCANSVWLW